MSEDQLQRAPLTLVSDDPDAEEIQDTPLLLEAALEQSESGLWAESVDTNEKILAIDPEDVSALNRLGRSLTKLGRLREALEAYQRAVSVDPANAIALRNSARLQGVLQNLGSDSVPAAGALEIRAEHFVLETSRSAVLSLEDLSPADRIATILPGDVLELRPEGPYLWLYTLSGDSVGVVPAERAHRLIELITAGNSYSAVVVNASVDGVRVLIRETYRSPETHGKLPFPAVTRSAPEARTAARVTDRAGLSEEDLTGESDADDDGDDTVESTTVPLSEAEDADDEESEE